jgi:murein DD-endopeptidase MepM/ murein hydrolase activator NlpD
MQQAKGVILTHKSSTSQRRRGWFAALAAIPLFGVVAAFGIAPDTLVDPIPVERVVREIALPSVQPAESDPPAFVREERINRGDTVAGLLARLNVDDPDAVQFLRQSKDAKPLAELRAGRSVRAETTQTGALLSVSYLTPEGKVFKVKREGDGFKASQQTPDLERRLLMKSGEIRSSLFAATDAAGLSDAVASQIAEIFSSEIDFHRDLRRGDRFAVVYETFFHEGEQVRPGRVIAAEFVNQGRSYQAVWFETAEGQGAYYTPDGRSLRKAFLRSPLEFTRISSGFSMRFHPILQQWRAHRGIDYAAPVGTRVRATGDGVVEFAGSQGAYGNLVILKHAGQYSTYYAHLSGFANGVRKGTRIQQGEVIGFVGQTGLATGPHLHYEFLIAGVQHDPLKVVLPEAQPITRELRAGFDGHVEPLSHRLELLRTTNLARLD